MFIHKLLVVDARLEFGLVPYAGKSTLQDSVRLTIRAEQNLRDPPPLFCKKYQRFKVRHDPIYQKDNIGINLLGPNAIRRIVKVCRRIFTKLV